MKYYKGTIPEVSLKIKPGTIKKVKIESSEDAHKYLLGIYDEDKIEYNESSIVVFTNRAINTIAWIMISQGGLTATVIDQRMIVKAALDIGAVSLILSHNHPSGNVKPSQHVISITNKVIEAFKLFDITLHVHIIMGVKNYYSFSDNDLL